MEPDSNSSDPSLLVFAALIFAAVFWVVVVVIVFPRLLGRILAFLANRASRGAFHVVIPVLHIYPLAGRVVAHSLRYTVADATFSVEELVLQIRWWRKAPASQFRQLLVVDDANTLDPVAHAQEELLRENSARFAKRVWYKLRRWWRRSAGATDGNRTENEPPPLISLIAVGLRVRLVNMSANYEHVKNVVALAKLSGGGPGRSRSGGMDTHLNIPLPSEKQSQTPAADDKDQESSASSYSSEQSVDEKPFRQRIAELTSIRITSGAFYLCDMGESPLIRLVVDTAKIRYRYGAPACPVDECRKRLRVRMSGLHISVADREVVRRIVQPVTGPETPAPTSSNQDNTDRMIKRVLAMGYKGIGDPYIPMTTRKRTPTIKKRPRALSTSSDMRTPPPPAARDRKPSFRYTSRADRREARRSQVLPCADLLVSETAVLDYVFDEPGPVGAPQDLSGNRLSDRTADLSSEGITEDTNSYPPPVCRVSILLRGASFSYETKAVANIERVLERIQPALYDLMPLAMEAQSRDGKRSATGVQIEIDATPISSISGSEVDMENPPLVSIPFEARSMTWNALKIFDVRDWSRSPNKAAPAEEKKDETNLPPSSVDIHGKHISVRTEVPYRIGAQQRTVVVVRSANAVSRGVVEMPLCSGKTVTVTRTLQFPRVWNGVHSSTVDINLRDVQVTYVPDTLRIIDDLVSTIQANNKKPPDVRYFVPFKETTKIRAENKYKVILACSQDNAWEDIHSFQADEYGKVVVSGETAELLLSQGMPTEFLPDTTVLSWSLSLPNASGHFELPLQGATSKKSDGKSEGSTKPLESERSLLQRGRQPSLARRVRSQLGTIASHFHHRHSATTKPASPTATIDFVKAGSVFKLTGKVLLNEERKYLGSTLPLFLDSVDRSDINLKASSVALDINPHHITNLLNLTRNYAGRGTHLISTHERDQLHLKRREAASRLLGENRYPFLKECVTLGLGAGQALSALGHRKAMDELLCLSFHIDAAAVRLHDLPHAWCSFDENSPNVFSITCAHLLGNLRASLLGMDLVLSPENRNRTVSVHFEHRTVVDNDSDDGQIPSPGNASVPCLTIERFRVQKCSVASPDWGWYNSHLSIEVGNLFGCLPDSSVLSIVRFILAAVPDPIFEDQAAAAALLSVDNIEFKIGKVDALVLSTSSNASAERSGQVSKLSLLQQNTGSREAITRSSPMFLTGVSHVRAPVGLRFLMSNLASEKMGSQTRIVVPDLTVDVLISWGGKLTPWVDEATIRAQVAHATFVRVGNRMDMFSEGGPMRRAGELRETTLEIVLDSRPRTWSENVAELQRQHISRQGEKARGVTPVWSRGTSGRQKKGGQKLSSRDEVEVEWWTYLGRSRRAVILEKHMEENLQSRGKVDSLSICIVSNMVALISPEGLELVNDIIIRCKEEVLESLHASLQKKQGGDGRKGNILPCKEVAHVWRRYEALRPPRWASLGYANSGELLRGMETRGVKIVLKSPLSLSDAQAHDALFPSDGNENEKIYISTPLGVHFLEIVRTEIQPNQQQSPDTSRTSKSSSVTHTRVFHTSIPELSVGCLDAELGQIAGLLLVLRKRSRIRRDKSLQDQVHEALREDKDTCVVKLASMHIGRPNSDLNKLACFGRVTSIFLLMSRALTVELISLTNAMEQYTEHLYGKILPASMQDLLTMNPGYVRTYFSEAYRLMWRLNMGAGGKENNVVSTSELPPFPAEEASELSERFKRGLEQSIDLTLRNLCLRLANEDIIRTDVLLCKGGSTESARGSSSVDGYVLSASFGTVSLCIRDDIAANTLQMVSEVASFVRKATVSMPILRYDGSRASKKERSRASELLSYSYSHEENLQAGISNPLEHVLLNPEQQRAAPRRMRSPRLSRRNRKERRLSALRLHHSSHEHFEPSRSRGTNSYGSPRMSNDLSRPWRNTSRPFSHGEERLQFDSISQFEGEGNTNSNPFSEKPRRGVQSARIDTRTEQSSGTSKQRSNESLRWFDPDSTFDDDNASHAYIAIPTAGETGPPRKKAKARIRLAPLIPPAFSDLDRNSTPRPPQSPVDLSQSVDEHRGQTGDEQGVSIQEIPSEVNRTHSLNEHTMGTTFSSKDQERHEERAKVLHPKKRVPLTFFVSCREILSQYYRRRSLPAPASLDEEREPDLSVSLRQPRVAFMSEPSKGSTSLVVTSSSAKLRSGNNPHCILTGSVARIGVTVSIAEGFLPSTLPKLIASARISEFKTILRATDLKSVLDFRKEFKSDLKAVLSAFVTSKNSISEMARATRLSSAKVHYPGRSLFSTMAFDLLCEDSMVKLEGFHPKDSAMCISYLMDGMFFSVVASEHEKAVLTLGLRLYGHGLCLSAPSWPSDERFFFPSLDARGVQWGETTGLPTLLKVSAEPLVNSTSIQGLRHVVFTVAGLMAFQSSAVAVPDLAEEFMLDEALSKSPVQHESPTTLHDDPQNAGATPFTRSFAAWERTKGVRMDLSIRPMSISLASGQVVARFNVEAITGIFEWNKLVRSGVQLHAAVGIPRISLMFLRVPAADFAFPDISANENRASMSVSLERSRLDVLKSQEDLTHTFIFRLDIFAVSGQVRPWRLLMDAAVWADEQELVSDLQSINYVALSSSRPRTPRSPRTPEAFSKPLEHRVMLVGANVQRFKLAVPLLNSEEYSSSRLALRATELHVLARHRFDNHTSPQNNTMEVKTHFIGVLWENTALLSSHHARVTLSVESASPYSNAHFGAMKVVMVAGTWRICPRKDVVVAILEAKNGRDNRLAAERSREVFSSLPDVLSRAGSSVAGDSTSNTTERHGRMLVESLQLKILQTSGFIEGLGGDIQPNQMSLGENIASSSRVQAMETSKLTVPAFSIAMVRDDKEDFDLIDVDFSGREGEFPRQCLQKVENLFSELFGAVASDQQRLSSDRLEAAPSQPREISRDTSVLIRFGKSLYRAQEEAHTSVESKFCVFADRFSSLLVSLTTRPIFGDESGHTTVITGVSPRLSLEVTPLIEGADTQSLRLIDFRFLHGVSPCRPPHTLIHIGRVTALTDIKTIMLAERHIQSRRSLRSVTDHNEESVNASGIPNEERNMMLVLGRSGRASKGAVEGQTGDKSQAAAEETQRMEADIRIQIKVPLQAGITSDQMNFFGERVHFGVCRTRRNPFVEVVPLNIHVALHEVNVRAQWDIMSCKFRLRENLFSCSFSGTSPREGGHSSITNIMNRLHFESMQSGNHTMKLAVDALASYWAAPSREVLIESTTVDVEIAHKLMTSIMRLIGQMRKLNGEVRLLVEREISKDVTRGRHQRLYSYEGRSDDSYLSRLDSTRSIDDREGIDIAASPQLSMGSSSRKEQKLKRSGKATTLTIRGDGLGATLRGYQFEETQHSAMVLLTSYVVNYSYSIANDVHIKQLGIDFLSTKMTYNDDERGIHSELFRIPSPALELKIVDGVELDISLVGNLEVKLGPGFYHWQKFRELAQLTVNGITPATESNQVLSDPNIWDGRRAKVQVAIKPRIDVIGGLTEDMLEYLDRKREAVRIVPKALFEVVGVHLENLSEQLCDILFR